MVKGALLVGGRYCKNAQYFNIQVIIILAIAILGSTALFNPHQYFWLYDMCWGQTHTDPLFFCVVSDNLLLMYGLNLEIRLIIFEATKSQRHYRCMLMHWIWFTIIHGYHYAICIFISLPFFFFFTIESSMLDVTSVFLWTLGHVVEQ